MSGTIARGRAKAASGLLLLAAAFGVACRRHPSDREMVERFQARRAEFDAFAEQLMTDPRYERLEMAARLRDGDQATGVTPSEFSDYQQQLRGLGVIRINNPRRLSGNWLTYLAASEIGVPHGQTVKGYAWGPGATLDGPLVERLDGRVRADGRAYKSLGDGWYLFFAPN